MRFLDAQHFQIGLDHWLYGGPITPPVLVDLGKPHIFVISLGSLYPDENAGVFAANPAWLKLRKWIYVEMDGQILISEFAESYPTSPKTVLWLNNLIGATTAITGFTGDFHGMTPASPDTILQRISSRAK